MNEYCEQNIYLIIEPGNAGYTSSFPFTIQQLTDYRNTGDSGNYNTNFTAYAFESSFPLTLPNVMGVDTTQYGISNLNDLLNIAINQNNLSTNSDIPDLGFGDVNVNLYWSLSPNPPSSINPTEVMMMVHDCLYPPEEDPIDPTVSFWEPTTPTTISNKFTDKGNEKIPDKKPLQESVIKRLQKLAGIKKSKK